MIGGALESAGKVAQHMIAQMKRDSIVLMEHPGVKNTPVGAAATMASRCLVSVDQMERALSVILDDAQAMQKAKEVESLDDYF